MTSKREARRMRRDTINGAAYGRPLSEKLTEILSVPPQHVIDSLVESGALLLTDHPEFFTVPPVAHPVEEQCSYCDQLFPIPIRLHHSETECSEGLVSRDGVDFSEYVTDPELNDSFQAATDKLYADITAVNAARPEGAVPVTKLPDVEEDAVVSWDLLDSLHAMRGPTPEQMQEVPPIREQILVEAAEAVMGDRDVSYGGPEDSFTRIADLWEAHFGYHFDAGMVSQALILLKLARVAQNPGHRDSWVDLAGYAACGAEVSGAVA